MIPSGHKIFQKVIKYNNIFYCKALHILPKLGFLVLKQTIWQPWVFEANRGWPLALSFKGAVSYNIVRPKLGSILTVSHCNTMRHKIMFRVNGPLKLPHFQIRKKTVDEKMTAQHFKFLHIRRMYHKEKKLHHHLPT
jgi:hypothetical protein